MDMIENPTMDDTVRLIDNYCAAIQKFLVTGVHNIKPKQYMEAYNCVVKLSDEHSLSEDLYQLYKKKVDEMLANCDQFIQAKVGDSKEYLTEYIAQWRNYTLFIHSLNKIMQYLDRFHLKNQGDQSLTETALNMFRDRIFKRKLAELRKCVLTEIKADREGEIVDFSLIKKSIDQFIYMGYVSKVIICKRGATSVHEWVGERNLMVYDRDFEK